MGITAYLGLFRDAKLGPGETVFVTGGTGGVGSTVVQFAKAAGAKVFTAARDAKGVQACRDLGADGVVMYTKEDLVQRVKDFAPAASTSGSKPVANPTSSPRFRCCRREDDSS